ncbi:hypothetical protein ACQEVF_25325 [Nonomuraea polychroma]|uniref:hypothetical protein n=1 Tax=Nonomuraea polychroma TaxID=46176 RepID=UPI003D8C0B15
MEITVDVDTSGPLFRTGYAEQVIRSYLDEATLKVAGVGKADVDTTLRKVLRNPTGYYQAHIKIRDFVGAAVIHDSRVIYGAWLEGIGSRNFPVTKFTGYFTFKQVHGRLEEKAGEVAGHVLHQYVRRLN